MTIEAVIEAGDPEDRLRKARSLLQGAKFGEAAEVCSEILADLPQHQEALYTLAVAQRFGGDAIAALSTLASLIDLSPSYGRAWQERGHCFRALNRSEEAFAAYQAAVTHNGALPASWRMLGELHRAAGRDAQAEFAIAQANYLVGLPPELQTVASLIQEGRIARAEKFCRAFLQKNGHHVEGMRLLAEIGTRFNAFDEAEFLLESCKLLKPDNVSAQYDYAKLLRKRHKFEQALTEAQELRAKEPGNPEFEMLYANENLAVGNFDEAMETYETLIRSLPNNPGVSLTHGHALKTVGRQDEAISAYRRAYAIKPDLGDAFWSLANLKTYRFSNDELEQMREQEALPSIALADRYHLCFALGKALEDRGHYEDSFAYYERGNRLKREELKYDPQRLATEMELQREHVSAELIARFANAGSKAPDPIFIVGLPRAGSTLLEQILASHSQVEGTMELPNILALAHRLDHRRMDSEDHEYPANLTELSAEEATRFGEDYIRDTQIYRKEGTPLSS